MTRVIKADAMKSLDAPQAGVLNLMDIAEQARAIILEARQQAAQIVATAQEHAHQAQQEIARRAYDEGLARGQSDGYAAGLQQADAQARATHAQDASQLLDVAAKLVEELTAAKAQLLEQARQGTLQFAVELARKIVHRVAATDFAAAQANLEKALGRLHGESGVTVRVNPQQLAQFEALGPQLIDIAGGAARGVRFIADEQIAPGGVKVACGGGEIDATIRTQMDNVVAALTGGPAEIDGTV